MFFGTEIRPPSRGRTPTPPPAPCVLWERREAPIPLVGAMSLHAVQVFLRLLLRRCRRVT